MKRFVALFFLFALSSPTLGTAASLAPPSSPHEIRLRARIFTPPSGVDPAALRHARQARAAGAQSVLLVLQLPRVPGQVIWNRLAGLGVEKVSTLGDTNWFVRVPTAGNIAARLAQVVHTANASALTVLQPTDKAAPRLAAMGPEPWHQEVQSDPRYEPWAYDLNSDLLRVVVQFFPDTPAATMQQAVRSVHRGTTDPVALTPTFWALQIRPGDLEKLLAIEELHTADLGPRPQMTLLNDARWKTGADELQQIQFTSPPTYTLSGKGVSLSNGEGLDTTNQDFWNHDAAGIQTTPRWAPTCSAGGGGHGTMTAGIALGNGFLSKLQGGAPYQWRGVAPEATFACLNTTEDVSNHSYVQTFGDYDSFAASLDSQIRGDAGGDMRPQVWAVANQGIISQYGTKVGYYSVYAPAKNSIAVANLSAATLRWMQSSLGPTWDGRIKPDLGAPGSKELFPDDKSQLLFDLDSLEVSQVATSLLWSFNGGQATWHGGWAQDPWWGRQNLGPISQLSEGSTQALRVPLLGPPYGVAFSNRPLVGTLTRPDGTTPLAIDGGPTDTVKLRYRLESDSLWRPASAAFTWIVDPATYAAHSVNFDVVADGAWHTVVLPLGTNPDWNGSTGIQYLYLRFGGTPMISTGQGGVLIADGGSSAAAPVVSGAIALLMEQLAKAPFGIQLGTHSSSPFSFVAPGTGVPKPSTFKALLVQGARDLASVPHADEPNNPDTGVPTEYHQGPDLATGYGLLDVAESSRILAAHTASHPVVVERQLHQGELQTYNLTVPASPRGPLKVTLAWDDPASDPLFDETAPALVNSIRLTLVAPDGSIHYPYSIDQPYIAGDPSVYPSTVEPQPISAADIHPAHQDRPNDLDNLQQVFVENPLPGPWQVKIKAFKLGAPPQTYSLILGTPPLPANHLNGGKVVFSSDRVNPAQLFVQPVGATGAPKQMTNEPFGARHPSWSRNGKYLAYVGTDLIVDNSGNGKHVDSLVVIDANSSPTAGVPPLLILHGYQIGGPSLGYDKWSDDGRTMVVTFWTGTGPRGLALIDFHKPYQFNILPTVTVLIPPFGVGPGTLNPGEALFSADGGSVYFTADSTSASGQIFRIPVTGGTPTPLYGNGVPIRRAFAPSLSPDGTLLNYNSEMWKEDPVLYQDEELLQVGLRTGVIRRLTAEPGNQYGWFAKNGAGEMVVRSNATPAGKSDLFLEENGVRVKLSIADPNNTFGDEGPDWWKTPCGGSAVLWNGSEPVGCKFSSWGFEEKTLCGSWVVLPNSGSGTCTLCVDPAWVTPILSGLVPLTEGVNASATTPAALSCR